MIITCYLHRGEVRGLGLPVFDARCVDFRQPPQEGLPFGSIHMLEGSLGVSLLRRQEPPIRGISHLNGRVPQCHEPLLVGTHPWGRDARIVLLLLSSICKLLI